MKLTWLQHGGRVEKRFARYSHRHRRRRRRRRRRRHLSSSSSSSSSTDGQHMELRRNDAARLRPGKSNVSSGLRLDERLCRLARPGDFLRGGLTPGANLDADLSRRAPTPERHLRLTS